MSGMDTPELTNSAGETPSETQVASPADDPLITAVKDDQPPQQLQKREHTSVDLAQSDA